MKMMRKSAVGIMGIAVFIAALCCVALAADLSAEAEPAAVDAAQYADFMSEEVLDLQDLAQWAEIQRRFFNRITPADVSLFQPMSPPVVPFDAANYADDFLKELLGEDMNSVAVYPLSLALDPETRETLIYNADGKLIAAVSQNNAFPAVSEGEDPSRVMLQLDLLPTEDVEPYLYVERRVAESLAAAEESTELGGAAMMSLEEGEFGFVEFQSQTNGTMLLTVTNSAGTAEVFSYTVWHTADVVVVTYTNEQSNVVTDTNTLWYPVSPPYNGMESAWTNRTTNLACTNGVGVWEDANVVSNARVRFYAVTLRTDSDGDGLTDGAETFVHHTNPGTNDTDADGLNDYAEVVTYGTGPMNPDTDGDGLTDGLEIRWGWFDPLDSNSPPPPAVINGENGKFRVWAPNATSVSIPGEFNAWNTSSNLLIADGNGYWTGTVANASFGQAYKIYIPTASNAWRRDPRGRALSGDQQNSIIVDSNSFAWSDDGFSPVPRNSLVVYQMHIGGFTLQTTNGTQGTFQNSISNSSGRNINYVKNLGANTIALLPVAEFNTGTSWGYNPVYPFSVEQLYGAYETCKQFVNANHGLGMGVWFDVVYNHFENNFSSLGAPPTDTGDLWRFDGWNSSNAPGGIYYYANTPAKNWLYPTPFGPRPNYASAAVREYIRDNALMWINEFHGDGLRWDFTKGIRNGDDNLVRLLPEYDIADGWNLMQWVNEEMRKADTHAIAVAEDLADDPELVTNVRANGAGFDSQWTTEGFCYPVRDALKSPTANIDINTLSNAVNFTGATDVFSRVIYLESHDEVGQLNSKYRVVQEIANAKGLSTGHAQVKKLSSLGGALVLSAPGIPMLFMGQEFLEDGQWSETIPLGWSKTNTFSGMVQMYRDLIALRKNVSGKTQGLLGQGRQVYGPVDHSNKVLVFRRWDQGGPSDDVVVIANFGTNSFTGNYEIGLPRAGNWIERFNGDKLAYDSSFGNIGAGQIVVATSNPLHGQPCRGAVSFGAMSVVILSQED